MGNVPVSPSWGKPSPSSIPSHIRKAVESRAICPWCGAQMYLNRTGDRLLCVDSIHCAGVMSVDEQLVDAACRPAVAKEVA